MSTVKKLTDNEMFKIKQSWILDGNVLIWKVGRCAGKPVATSVRRAGHQNVFLRVDGKLKGFVLARIIWLLRTGEYPDLYVEHRDGNPQNNSVNNLRLATHSQNMANLTVGRTGREKKGVYLNKKSGKYYVQVQKDGIVHGRCGFLNFDDAYIYRQSLAQELFGEYAR
jgi:hypothetical protein